MDRVRNELLLCTFCGKFKYPEEFYIDHHNKYGRKWICKECDRLYSKEYQYLYYLKHRDKLLPKHRETARLSFNRKQAKLKGEIKKWKQFKESK